MLRGGCSGARRARGRAGPRKGREPTRACPLPPSSSNQSSRQGSGETEGGEGGFEARRSNQSAGASLAKGHRADSSIVLDERPAGS